MPAHKQRARRVTVVLPGTTPVPMGEGFAVEVFDQYSNTVLRYAPPQDRRNKSRYRMAVTYTGREEEAAQLVERWSGVERRREEASSVESANAPEVVERVDAVMRFFSRNSLTLFAALQEKMMMLIRCAMDMYDAPVMPAQRRDEYAAMPIDVLRGLLHFRFPALSFPEFAFIQRSDDLADVLAASIVVPLAAIDARWLDMTEPTDTDARILKELFVDLNEYPPQGVETGVMLSALKTLAEHCKELVSVAPHRVYEEAVAMDGSESHVRVYKCHYFTRRAIADRYTSSSVLRFSKFPLKSWAFYQPARE